MTNILEYDVKKLGYSWHEIIGNGVREDIATVTISEKELSICKSRNDQLESDNRWLEIQKTKYQTESQKKQAQLEIYQKENNALIKCKHFG